MEKIPPITLKTIVKDLAEGCRHLDAIGAERHVLDVGLVCTNAKVAELWSASLGETSMRFCTHPFHQPGLRLLSDWLKGWAGEHFQKAADEAELWMSNSAATTLPLATVRLPSGPSRGSGYLWGRTGEVDNVSHVVRVGDKSLQSRHRVFWLLCCGEKHAEEVKARAEQFLVAVSKADPTGCRAERGRMDPSDDALRNSLTTLRLGVQEDLPKPQHGSDQVFSVLFLKRAEGHPQGMSFRFDSEQTSHLARDEGVSQIIQRDAEIRDSIIARGSQGLATLLEEVRYDQQFAGRVMKTCQAAKFPNWRRVSQDEFPREQEQEDRQLRIAREILDKAFLKEHLYQIPLVFEGGESAPPNRPADLIIVITSDQELEEDEWRNAQLSVRKHARFLQLANQLDQIRADIAYLDRSVTAHQQLSRIGRLVASLGDLADSSSWATVGRDCRVLLMDMEADLKRLLGRSVSAPRDLPGLVNQAWEQTVRGHRTKARLWTSTALGAMQLQLTAELAPILLSALECVFDNAIKACAERSWSVDSWVTRQFVEVNFGGQQQKNLPSELTTAGLFDDHAVVVVLPDDKGCGFLIFNHGPRPTCDKQVSSLEILPLALSPAHGLTFNAKYLDTFGWSLKNYASPDGLWWTHLNNGGLIA